MKSRLTISLLSLLIVVLLLTIILYLAKFGSWHLSNNFSDWVSFSTYFYNFLIIVLTVINIAVVMYIAKIAQSFDTTKHKENIELQEQYEKKRRLHECKMKLIELLEIITKNIVATPDSTSLIISQSSLNDFSQLFSKELNLSDDYENLLRSINDVITNIEENKTDEEKLKSQTQYILAKQNFIENFNI